MVLHNVNEALRGVHEVEEIPSHITKETQDRVNKVEEIPSNDDDETMEMALWSWQTTADSIIKY